MEKQRGGKREGAGRKPVAEEKRVTDLIVKALKGYHSVETDEEAKEKFIIDLYGTTRGQIFLAEHLFGKPKETVDNNINLTDFNISELVRFKD
jgi:hypothetical protein